MIKRTFAFTTLVAATATALACPFCKVQKTGLFYGETKIMGNGVVRSWVDIAEDGKPTTIGVALNQLAMQNLPDIQNGMPPEWVLKLPEAANVTPFDHISIEWNKTGHEPAKIYDKPHFDFHFYMIPTAKRSEITLVGDNKKVCTKPVPKGYMAPNYIAAPGTDIKYMGQHWVTLAGKEFQGQAFDQTLIYGSYDGKVAFVEPMITAAFLESKPDFRAAIPQAPQVERAGYYPTEYTIRYDEARQEYRVTLEKFVYRAPAKLAKY